MNYTFSAEEEAFRAEVRAFLEEELPSDWDGLDESGAFQGQGLAITHRMSKKLAERGWLTLAWPKEHGGQERSVMEQMLFKEEMAYFQVPGADMGVGGVSWVGPMLMYHGTDEQKRHLRSIASGDEYWCTLYSEPGSGSDLASLQTRAELDGDDYVINGSKIWTSGGHIADWGWLAARTDPTAPKHKGVSMFLLDMKSPGVTVRPIINMAEAHHFNEVFFDNVRIPKRDLVGDENQGWYILASALDFERSGVHASANAQRLLDRLAAFFSERPGAAQRRAPQPLRRGPDRDLDRAVAGLPRLLAPEPWRTAEPGSLALQALRLRARPARGRLRHRRLRPLRPGRPRIEVGCPRRQDRAVLPLRGLRHHRRGHVGSAAQHHRDAGARPAAVGG